MIPLEQFGPVEQSSDFASHLYILAFQSVHFVDKFLMTTIVASTFAQLCLYVAGDDLLLGMTIRLHAFRSSSYSVSCKVIENVVMASFFPLRNHKCENENR
ncbi:hypothetical protein TNCV_3940621 [Trichonephila clavipes]|uniref:Uncharacterized protein n=1 Tax=Trichonephila clavipes TaxID=2585209 RepID=A0A8X6VVV3_TRICX|nr:hypothetical protein TNCV_3940621 [Trichonephila clavipes]